jgi:transcriptional antiterminator NusG
LTRTRATVFAAARSARGGGSLLPRFRFGVCVIGEAAAQWTAAVVFYGSARLVSNERNGHDMPDEAKWYVVHTYAGYEKTAAATIEKAAENRRMQDLILEVNIPTETVVEIAESQQKTVERKVFPGYLLVKMILTDDSWHLVRNVRGVTGFVGSSNKAVPLTDDEIAALGIERREIHLKYSVGSVVRIVDGPLADFEGTVEEIEADRGRVRVTVQMFGRETAVDLDFDQVQALE